MPGSAPQTSNWKAVEDRQPPGVNLTVTGKVKTTNSNQVPHLAKANPQGFNPAILLLDLSITTSGDAGGTVNGTRDVEYREDIKAGQYTSVQIRHEGKGIALIDHIEVVH
jgi:hypothetical protein